MGPRVRGDDPWRNRRQPDQPLRCLLHKRPNFDLFRFQPFCVDGRSPSLMKKLVIVVAKSALVLVSLAGVSLLVLAGWLVWHYEYSLGLPTEAQLAALSSTGPACT